MKIGKDYFDLLSEKEKKQFENNVDDPEFFKILMECENLGLKQLVNQAFVWCTTNEGHLYWGKIANRKNQEL